MPMNLIFFFFINFSQAAPQNIVIDSKLIYQGARLSAPRMTTLEGRKTLISETDKTGKTKFKLEFRPLVTSKNFVRMQYSFIINEPGNEIHSRGTVKLKDNQQGIIYLDKGRVQVQLKVNRS